MWMFSSYCDSDAVLTGKTAVVTGGNTGIGYETAKDLYKRGARVIIACRNIKKAEDAINSIQKELENEEGPFGVLVVHQLDLNSLQVVRESAQKLLESEEHIHILVNNAGIYTTPDRYTEDGYESHFAVNHLGHFLFTLLLLPKLKQSAPARIVNVSSDLYKWGSINFEDLHFKNRSFGHTAAYSQSKLANILFTRELAKRLKEAGCNEITTYSLHPGVVFTDATRNFNLIFPGLKYIVRFFWRLCAKTCKQGAQTTIYCTVSEKCAKETGLYYSECKATSLNANALDDDVAKKLWDVSLNLVGLPENYELFSKYVQQELEVADL